MPDRVLVVVTDSLIKFEMPARSWMTVDAAGHDILVYKDDTPEPGQQPTEQVGRFNDVHAVYWKDSATLVLPPPDTDDD